MSAVSDTSHSPHARLAAVGVKDVNIEGGPLKRRRDANRAPGLMGQWRELEATTRLDALRQSAGLIPADRPCGKFVGDSDLYKWIEAVSWGMGDDLPAEVKARLDDAIDLVTKAQQPDGYLFTPLTFAPEKRWQDLKYAHELYCGGHLIQAALANRRMTGDDRLMSVARKWADLVDSIFGPGLRPGACGHPEVETALVELYRETRDRKYLDLAAFFLEQRGRGLFDGDETLQDHATIRQQTTVVGHVVRQFYLCAGVADVYAETGDGSLLAALRRQWADLVERKMFISASAGVFRKGEGFGVAYELPNQTAYNETCAAIALFQWAWRMLQITAEAAFADLMEMALYNGILCAVSLDGCDYFYANPIEHSGDSGALGRAGRGSNRRSRIHWDYTACCPPNLARLLTSLPGYLYGVTGDDVFVHHYAPGVALLGREGRGVRLRQETRYPWDGRVLIRVEPDRPGPFALCLRVPGWTRRASVRVNGVAWDGAVARGQYVRVQRPWQPGDQVEMNLPMPPRRIVAHPRATMNAGSVALMRGPVLYCLESCDHPGVDLFDIRLPDDAEIADGFEGDLLDGVVVLRASGRAGAFPAGRLYADIEDLPRTSRSVALTAVPYFAWANRQPGAMRVWIPRG